MKYSLRIALALAAAALLLPALAVSEGEIYLELQGGMKDPIPGTCSIWNELWPNFGRPWHQDGYLDSDGDGEVTICDYIKLDGQDYHIEWVGPTYTLVCMGEVSYFEPTEPQSGGNPTCEVWQEVWPQHGRLAHVDAWEDNGDGVVSVCDFVTLDGMVCHIEDIGLNITVVPSGPVPNTENSWGSVKSRY